MRKMEKRIRELNTMLLESVDATYPLGLAQGQMGICIYFYYLSQIEQNEEYQTIAEQLLDDTLNKLSLTSSISVENGLAGIALGVTHLINAGFVEGDVNDLLEEIDSVIFKRLAFLPLDSSYKKEELLHLLFYLTVRLTDQTDENDRYIFRGLIIKVINIFANDLKDDFFDESFSFSLYHYHLPLFTYICACLLEHNFYNDRIYKILEEFELKILSRFPVLHANRLFLLCGMLPLIPYMRNTEWGVHTDLLQKEIDLQVIIDKEMKNKHIFVSNGLSMIYLFLYYLEKNYPKNKISFSSQYLYEKIIASEAWESLFRHDYFFNIHCGLLNGFPGVQLVLSHIQKQNI